MRPLREKLALAEERAHAQAQWREGRIAQDKKPSKESLDRICEAVHRLDQEVSRLKAHLAEALEAQVGLAKLRISLAETAAKVVE